MSIKIISISKNGWETKEASKEKLAQIKANRNYTLAQPHTENTQEQFGESALYKKISDKIQIGMALHEIDTLPNNMRDLYQTNGRFFIGDYGTFIHEDPIIQALDGNFGNYDEDKDELDKEDKIALEIKDEQTRILQVLLTKTEKIKNDTSLSNLQKEILQEQIENEIKSIPSTKRLSFSLNSKYTAYGYSSPKEQVHPIDKNYNSDLAIAAEKRNIFFKELLFSLTVCEKKSQIFGTMKGKEKIAPGVMDNFRPLYLEDKALIIKWSNAKKEEAKEKFIDETRETFKTNKTRNEEFLRKELYWRFDRIAKVIPAKVNEQKNTTLSHTFTKIKPSKWEQDKAQAFTNLNLTMGQWKSIYKMKDIMVQRIDLDYKTTKEREDALEELRAGFSDIETLLDLKAYILNANNRNWKGSLFTSSLIDRISILDYKRWLSAIREKGIELSKKEKHND